MTDDENEDGEKSSDVVPMLILIGLVISVIQDQAGLATVALAIIYYADRRKTE